MNGTTIQNIHSIDETGQTDCLNKSLAGSEDGSESVQCSVIEQIANLNQDLEKQIDTLKLRLNFDGIHHQAAKESVRLSMESQMKVKQCTIDALKTELQNKDSAVAELTVDMAEKQNNLAIIQTQIDAMKENIDSAAGWISDIQEEIKHLESEKKQIETGEARERAQKEISDLKNEIYTFQQNMRVLSKEIHRAREVVSAQGDSIKIIETDKHNLQIKFKEDLQKLTMSVRHEIERMRDIMQNQWAEMKFLREHNQRMQQDVREIRELITMAKAQPDGRRLEGQRLGMSSRSFPPSKKPTRGSPHPVVPPVSSRRILTKRK